VTELSAQRTVPDVSSDSGFLAWWRRTAGGLPRPFWFLFGGTLVNRLGYVIEPFLALYLVRGRELPTTTVGYVVAAFGLGAFASQPIGGYLADVIGRRATIVAGLSGSAVAFLTLGAARDLSALLAAAVFAGLMIDLYRPAVAALVADLVSPSDRPRAFGLLYWAINLGVSIAGVLGGFLAERSYWLLFVLDALTCLVFAVLVARAVPETRPSVPAPGVGYRSALGDRLLVALAVLTMIDAVVYLQVFVTLPLAMSADGLGPAAYGIAYAVNPVAIILLQPMTLRWLARQPPVPVYAASSVVTGVGFGLTAFAHSVSEYAATVLVWTLGEIAFTAVAPAIVAGIAPESLRGRYNGVIGLAYGASAFVAPLVGTRLLHEFGGGVLWGSCLVASVVSAAGIVALGPRLRRRLAAVSQPSLSR
jgi:MFS family permease